MVFGKEQRVLRARLAAHALHASGRTNTAPGTKAFLDRFERQVDPDGSLDPGERARRAEHARKAYFIGLALKSSKKRVSRRSRDRALTGIDHSRLAAAPGARGRPPVDAAEPIAPDKHGARASARPVR